MTKTTTQAITTHLHESLASRVAQAMLGHGLAGESQHGSFAEGDSWVVSFLIASQVLLLNIGETDLAAEFATEFGPTQRAIVLGEREDGLVVSRVGDEDTLLSWYEADLAAYNVARGIED